MPNTFQTPEPIQEGDLLAAIDLGSNSYHMIIARYLLGQLRVVDRLRETAKIITFNTAASLRRECR